MLLQSVPTVIHAASKGVEVGADGVLETGEGLPLVEGFLRASGRMLWMSNILAPSPGFAHTPFLPWQEACMSTSHDAYFAWKFRVSYDLGLSFRVLGYRFSGFGGLGLRVDGLACFSWKKKHCKSADPGRRKGERVREEEVRPCYYYNTTTTAAAATTTTTSTSSSSFTAMVFQAGGSGVLAGGMLGSSMFWRLRRCKLKS